MNKFGHTIGGIIVSTTALYIVYKTGLKLETHNYMLIAAGIMGGSFVPDVDAEYSYIRSKMKTISKIYTSIQKSVKDIAALNNVFKHRGALFHSWMTLMPFIFAFLATRFYIFFGIAIGILGHHILDMMTPAKLRWLYPLKVKLIKFRKD